MHELLSMDGRRKSVTEQFLYLMNETGWYENFLHHFK